MTAYFYMLSFFFGQNIVYGQNLLIPFFLRGESVSLKETSMLQYVYIKMKKNILQLKKNNCIISKLKNVKKMGVILNENNSKKRL